MHECCARYPMHTLVSAFGIGGLSIGLASQAVLKDLVGTTILVFDEWFDVGSKITVQGMQVCVLCVCVCVCVYVCI